MKLFRASLRLKSIFFPLLVFSVSFAGYLATPRSSQVYSDSRWSIHLALSLIREGNLNLDEYKRMITPDDYAIRDYQGHKYSLYPIGAPLLAVPFVYFYNLLNPNTFAQIGRIHPVAQSIIASFITALTAVLIYLIANLSLNVKRSLFVAFIFAFCTSAWSTASRAIWQHGPSMLFLSMALYLLLLSKDKPWLVQFVSIPLAYSFIIRPSNAISIILLSLFVLLYYPKFIIKYILWSLIIALPFFLSSYLTYKSFLPPYYHSYGVFSIPSFLRLIGPLISPSRGLIIYTPIFLFSLFGVYLKLKNFSSKNPENILDILLLGSIVAHCLLVSSWWNWWGGYSIGPRMLSDMIPFMIYFLIPVISYLSNATKRLTSLRLAFLFCLLISFFIQIRGATTEALWIWNSLPTSIDDDQARMWDWSDPPFLRGLTWLDEILPPKLVAKPAEINLFCTYGAQADKCKALVEILDWRLLPFRWEANAPFEVEVVPAKGRYHYESSRLSIHLVETGYSPGVYNLGELKISAVRLGKVKWTDSMTIPIILHINTGDEQ